MSEKSENRVCITKEMNGTKIEVWFSNEGDIRDSVILLEKLSQRVPIEQTRFLATSLWKTVSGNLRIEERVTDKGHRISLTLLHAYPNPRNNSEIEEECDLSKDDVYNHLTGRSGDMKDWFTSVSRGVWILSQVGQRRITELVESYFM